MLAKSGRKFSPIGVGPISTMRNRPERSRSLRTTSVSKRGRRFSPSKVAMATGRRLAPAPVISIDICACASVLSKSAHSSDQTLNQRLPEINWAKDKELITANYTVTNLKKADTDQSSRGLNFNSRVRAKSCALLGLGSGLDLLMARSIA